MRGRLNVCLFFVLAAIGAAAMGCSDPDGGKDAATAGSSGAEDVLCKHEVADKFCPLCHPEVKKDPNILLCKEHGDIPEDICTACHPELKAKYKTCKHELPRLVCHTCLAASGGAASKTEASSE